MAKNTGSGSGGGSSSSRRGGSGGGSGRGRRNTDPPARYRDKKKIVDPDDAWRNAVGNRRAKSVTWGQKVKDVLKANGGDRSATMEALGIKDKRTLDRWLSGKGKPSRASQGRIDGAYNRPETRRGAMPARRVNRLKRDGMKVKAHGSIAANADPKYARIRGIAVTLPPDATERILDAYAEGGPEAAQAALLEEMREHYNNVTNSGMAWGMSDLDQFSISDLSEQERLDMGWDDRDD
ncbi:hypothetical protein [Cryptosporangium aurantiacum]|uniref:Uncharacterized protein n=1 Tax=Cryptosporangium aurantiacum TaxID=134849 RepID=A0A1M7RPE2_9ACTN|nr:hypothetical protein [Cryptosporangium aurantiacum]SHN48183.1 hypothetical protein SAMN05443668_1361 [Cryptosporangium aurantiacum]